MIGVFRDRQKLLLRHLLRNKTGLSVDDEGNLIIEKPAA